VRDPRKDAEQLPDLERRAPMYARVTTVRFPPELKSEVSRVATGLGPILERQRGFEGFQVLTDPDAGEGIIASFWGTEADVEASEAGDSYTGQMSMMSSFLYEPLAPKTYEVDART
jgi:heme-degrading monooxygenase HmoA